MIQLLEDFKNGKKAIHRYQYYDILFYKEVCYFIDDYIQTIRILEEEDYMKYFNEAFYQNFINNNEYAFYPFDISEPMEMIKGNIFENDDEEKIWYIDDNVIIKLFYRGSIIENPFEYFIENFERITLIDLLYEVWYNFVRAYNNKKEWDKYIKKI
tara:strand:+ start:87 stop:554 length:468 start_codon:yes stop_codon:yes gene_type:complete